MTDTQCKHARIRTWLFEDSREVAGLWSCADCGRRFEPLAEVAQPMSGDEAHDLFETWYSDDESGVEFVRRVEREHKIGAAA